MNSTIDKPETQQAQTITGHYAKVHIPLNEPWQVTGAFQTMREAAKLNGFPDIEDIHISLEVTFYSHGKEGNVEGLKTRLDDVWLGADVETKPHYRKQEPTNE